MEKKKKLITGGAIGLAVIVAVAAIILPNRGTDTAVFKTEPLARRTLLNTISTTGVVESVDSTNVYSTLTSQVIAVNVSVGDKVEAGAVLCQLDTDDLEREIAKQQTQIDNSNKTSQINVQSSQETYNTAKSNLENGLNSQLVSADNTLASSKSALDSAFKSYQNAKNNLENDMNSQILSAEATVEQRSTALDDALRAYNNAKSDLNNGNNASINSAEQALDNAEDKVDSAKDALNDAKDNDADDDTIDDLEDALDNARDACDNAEENLDTAVTSAERSLENLKSAYDSAQTAYDNAVTSRDATTVSVNQELEKLQLSYENAKASYENAVKSKSSAQISAEQSVDTYKNNFQSNIIAADDTANQLTLQKLQAQLDDSSIKSPISGTVTAVFAKKGSSPNGVLFVIENTDSLQVATTIKEYDVDNAKLGMKATIKTDGTGDKEFTGTVSKISPTAVKASDGKTMTGTNVEFDTDIAVAAEHEGLRIGMNARINIILEERADTYGVPYDAIAKDKDGNSVVYTAVKDDKGNYTAKAIKVETGLETNFYVEISGEGCTDGILIITNPKNLTDGAKVQVDI